MTQLRLRLLNGPRQGQEVVCSGPRVRVGRSRDNDLILAEHENSLASAHHAEARFEGGHWWIVDLGSTNGTLVNGARVDRQQLHGGDRLAFGDDEVLVRIGRPPALVPILAGAALLALLLIGGAYLLRDRPATLEEAAATAARSVYLVAIQKAGERSPLGTAFAVRADGLLATNAHVAHELTRRASLDAALPEAIVVRGDSDGNVRRIVAVWPHPGWHAGSIRDDVALIRLAPGDALDPLPLADDISLGRLRRGTPVAAFGFPATVTDAWKPRGRLSADVIGDIRDDRYLEVGLGIAPGTSGSPIFTSNGTVVGIVAGGEFVGLANGRETIVSGSETNWGIAVSVLRELLQQYAGAAGGKQ